MQELNPILERCRRGDNLAWEALVRRTQSRVYSLALQYVRDPDEASDLAQEIFIKIYRNLHKMETGSAFMPWMVRLSPELLCRPDPPDQGQTAGSGRGC